MTVLSYRRRFCMRGLCRCRRCASTLRATTPRRRRPGRCPGDAAPRKTRGAWWEGRLLLRDEAEGGGVHAVAQVRGRRSVLEDVAEVRVAAGAEHLGAGHEQGAVALGADALRGGGRPETGAAGARGQLGVGAEQRVAAGDADVPAGGLVVVV